MRLLTQGERTAFVLRMRGQTFGQIARTLDVCPQRAWQLWAAADDVLEATAREREHQLHRVSPEIWFLQRRDEGA